MQIKNKVIEDFRLQVRIDYEEKKTIVTYIC